MFYIFFFIVAVPVMSRQRKIIRRSKQWRIINVMTRNVSRNIWTATWDNMLSDICVQRRLKQACTSLQSDQRVCCPHKETLHPVLSKMCSVNILIRQTDLNLRWVRMPKGTFFLMLRLICSSYSNKNSPKMEANKIVPYLNDGIIHFNIYTSCTRIYIFTIIITLSIRRK